MCSRRGCTPGSVLRPMWSGQKRVCKSGCPTILHLWLLLPWGMHAIYLGWLILWLCWISKMFKFPTREHFSRGSFVSVLRLSNRSCFKPRLSHSRTDRSRRPLGVFEVKEYFDPAWTTVRERDNEEQPFNCVQVCQLSLHVLHFVDTVTTSACFFVDTFRRANPIQSSFQETVGFWFHLVTDWVLTHTNLVPVALIFYQVLVCVTALHVPLQAKRNQEKKWCLDSFLAHS